MTIRLLHGDPPCTDCAAAAERLWHGFSANCAGCRARSMARSSDFHRVRKAGALDEPYREMLTRLDLTHEAVKAAAGADRLIVDGAPA